MSGSDNVIPSAANPPSGGGEAVIGLNILNLTTEPIPDADREGCYSTSSTFPAPNVRVPLSDAGNLSKFVVNVVTNTLTDTTTYTVLVNGVATALAVTYAALESGVKTFAGPAAVLATDLVSFRAQTAAASGASTAAMSVRYA